MTQPSAPGPVLGGDFATPSADDWGREVLKVLNRRRPAGTELTLDKAMARLRTTTVDGLVIEPLYSASDTDAPLGVPGAMPFTRGAEAVDADATWDVRALHEDPDVAVTNAAALTDLRTGATSLWFRVGAEGVPPADLAAVLAGVDPSLAAIAVSSVTDQDAAAAALADVWRSGSPERATGNLGIDPLSLAAATGRPADLAPLAAWAQVAADEFGNARAITVDTLAYDNAGAGDVDQLAYGIATGIAYLRALDESGVAPERAFGQIDFRVSASADEFLTIARLRALRRVWARVGEVSGVPEAARGASQHAVMSWRMMTRNDPWVNLLRGTIACFAAAVGGAEAITTLPFDSVLGLPDEFSRRMARNTQLVAADESHLDKVADPAGGSWYVENLTNQLAEHAWLRVQQIEAAGGMAAALADGTIATQIGATVSERAKRLATRKQPITGVSMFPLAEEQLPKSKPRRSLPDAGGLRPLRDSEVFEALRDRTDRATSATGTRPVVFMACLGARRDFGAREQFTSNLLLVGGLAHPSSEGGTPDEIVAQARAAHAGVVVLCSSAKVYAAQALDVARALKAAGIATVYLAGRLTEVADDAASTVIDDEIFDGMDVVSFLDATLDRLGVSK